MKRNLGQTSLRGKSRTGNIMRSFDQLPKPLRLWLTNAALPWSPASAKKIWKKSMSDGLNVDEALARLTQAEQRSLARDKHSMKANVGGLPERNRVLSKASAEGAPYSQSSL